MPPAVDPMQGSPLAMASIMARGNPSVREGSTKRVCSVQMIPHRFASGDLSDKAYPTVQSSQSRLGLQLRSVSSVSDEAEIEVQALLHTSCEGIDEDVLSFI